MGVMSNLMLIRKKFRAIVGANWDGTTIDNITTRLPKPIPNLINDTDATTVNVGLNITGFGYQLQKKVGNTWTTVGNYVTSNGRGGAVSLSVITETSICRVRFYPFAYGDYGVHSNEFTVTRTAAQTQALKNSTKGDKLDAFDVEQPDVIMNKEEI